MTITTNDVQLGTVPGMMKAVTGSAVGCPPTVIYTNATPDAVVEGLGSQIAQDVVNDEFYMCETNGNTDWVHLISGT